MIFTSKMHCDVYTLVKQGRLWYTVAMKALLSFSKKLAVWLLLIPLSWLLCCAPPAAEPETTYIDSDVADEGEADGDALVISIHSSSGEDWQETFVPICESSHAVVYVSAHAIEKARSERLSDAFERRIYPMLSAMDDRAETPLMILLTFLEGRVYGYMEETDHGPMICLNALYHEDLEYALAHEYQHLCAYSACKDGQTTISEDLDELLSDMFCELLFPDQGRERNILSEKRAVVAQEKISNWGRDGLPHVYELLRAGYTEEEVLSAMENR